ncbi:hypothetical protein JN06_02277 [Bacteroides zoogleoformans]|nr:hypothetical protein JN06_02277 [Bacteroides zoogleoformans]
MQDLWKNLTLNLSSDFDLMQLGQNIFMTLREVSKTRLNGFEIIKNERKKARTIILYFIGMRYLSV